MTVTRRLDTTFTDQTINPLPRATPSPGVLGSAYMWLASDIAGSDGDAITSWPALLGDIDLTQPTSGKRPLLKIESGVKMLRFDGTDDELSPLTTLDAANLKTVTILARVRAVTGTQQGILNTSTGAVQRGSTTNTNVNGGGTGATNVAIAVNPTSTTVFQVITLALGNDESGNAVRAANVGATTAAITGDAAATTIRPGLGFVGTYGNIDVLAIIAWPFALTTVQRAAVRTAMQAYYGSIIA